MLLKTIYRIIQNYSFSAATLRLCGSPQQSGEHKRNQILFVTLARFTDTQLAVLRESFQRKSCPTRDEKAELAMAMNISELRVHDWFQRHRKKAKKALTGEQFLAHACACKPSPYQGVLLFRYDPAYKLNREYSR